METPALIMMLVTDIVISVITAYFFWKVLKTPLKDVEEDDAPFPRGG